MNVPLKHIIPPLAFLALGCKYFPRYLGSMLALALVVFAAMSVVDCTEKKPETKPSDLLWIVPLAGAVCYFLFDF